MRVVYPETEETLSGYCTNSRTNPNWKASKQLTGFWFMELQGVTGWLAIWCKRAALQMKELFTHICKSLLSVSERKPVFFFDFLAEQSTRMERKLPTLILPSVTYLLTFR